MSHKPFKLNEDQVMYIIDVLEKCLNSLLNNGGYVDICMICA